MSSMSESLPKPPVACMWNRRYSRNQSAIFPLLTRVNRTHHQARGFDRARHSDLMGCSGVIELTSTVTIVSRSTAGRERYLLTFGILLCAAQSPPEQAQKRKIRQRAQPIG